MDDRPVRLLTWATALGPLIVPLAGRFLLAAPAPELAALLWIGLLWAVLLVAPFEGWGGIMAAAAAGTLIAIAAECVASATGRVLLDPALLLGVLLSVWSVALGIGWMRGRLIARVH
jgi:hypothetical protein